MIKRHKKVSLFKIMAHYGVHIWAILIIANAALAYAFHFSTQAAKPIPQRPGTNQEVTGTSKDITPTIKPAGGRSVGPAISLTFTIPGIGSGSANMIPKRLERNVIIFLFASDANSLNKSVKPLYTIKTTAAYDTNTLSPTYTSYHVNNFDMGSDIKNGTYQIAFRADESLRTLIKENPEKVGGQLFEVKAARLLKIPPQKLLMGDTLPKEGDNTVDVSDYNAFVNCFGERNTTEFCEGNNYGDFDDNGVIDGVDYNLLLRSFSELLEQGQTIPQVTSAPTGPQRISRLSDGTSPTPEKKKVTPTKAVEQKTATSSGSGSSVLGGVLFFLFLLIVGAIVFVLYKKNEQFRTLVQTILKRTPPTPADPNAPATGDAAATPTEEAPQAETAPTTPEASPSVPPTDTTADPNAIAASTEIPITPPTEAAPTADPSAIAASTEIPISSPAATAAPAPATTAPPVVGDTVEKDCYVKKKLPDDAGTGFWLTLTDDNGALEAHYTTADVQDGFAKVKGTMKSENGKTFLEVAELVAEG